MALNRYMIIASLALPLLACGVKKETHQKVLDELNKCQTNLSGAQSKVASQSSRIKKLEGSLSQTRKELDKMSVAERKKALRIGQLMKQMSTTSSELEDKLNALRKQNEKAQARLKAYSELRNKLRALVDTGKLRVKFRKGQMVLELPSEVLFAPGRANLRRPGRKALNDVLQILLKFKDRRFMIAGHTDNVPVRGRFRNNWHLSTARARSVVERMIKAGFDPKNLVAAGYGEYDPVAKNDTKEHRRLNRRIEIILIPDLSELPNLKAPKS